FLISYLKNSIYLIKNYTLLNMEMLKKVAIIGSGICGAYLANALAAKYEVYVFEKARGLGGRSASKRQAETSFDYGVSYFSIQDPDLQSFLSGALLHENIELLDRKIIKLDRNDKENSGNRIVESFPERTARENTEGGVGEQSTEALFVSKPYGNSFAKLLLKDIKKIFLETKIQSLVKNIVTKIEDCKQPQNGLVLQSLQSDSKYKLVLEDAAEFDVDFDIIISTAPAEQTARIYSKYDDLVKSLSTVKYNPAFVLMFSLKQSAELFSSTVVSELISKIRDADILKIKNSIIEEVILNHKKPLRDSNTPAFVIKASKSFTENNLEMEHALIEEVLLNEFFSIMGFDVDSMPELGFKHLHRWLYSTPVIDSECKDLVNIEFSENKENKALQEIPRTFLKAEGEEIYAVGDYVLGLSSEFINDQNNLVETDLEPSGVEASLLSARALARILNFS
ncbi:MAG: NAD(P)-binding protein, partial [bacterium]